MDYWLKCKVDLFLLKYVQNLNNLKLIQTAVQDIKILNL